MTRDEIEALLPFLANDTLEGEERTEVEAAVAADPDLRAELEALRAIRGTMRADQGYSPGEMGLARLLRDVEAEAAPVRRPGTLISRPGLWQSVAAVLLVVVVGQAAFQLGAPDTGGDRDTFTLAGGEEPASAKAGAARISIAFTPGATEQQLRTLLLQAGVEIVSGPSELGLYQLSLAEGATLEDARAILEPAEIVDSLELLD